MRVGMCLYLDTDWAHSGTTTTVWNAEGLVQVEVRHISASITRTALQHLSTHTTKDLS